MTDDWKGEHLIRGRKPSPEERAQENIRLSNAVFRKRGLKDAVRRANEYHRNRSISNHQEARP